MSEAFRKELVSHPQSKEFIEAFNDASEKYPFFVYMLLLTPVAAFITNDKQIILIFLTAFGSVVLFPGILGGVLAIKNFICKPTGKVNESCQSSLHHRVPNI